MEVNGKKPDIAGCYFNSMPTAMVLEESVDGEKVSVYLPIGTSVIYSPIEGENNEIVGKVCGNNSIQTDTHILEIPYSSKIKVVDTGFTGKTIEVTDDSLDILYDALDWQVYTAITNVDGFASTKTDDIQVGTNGNPMNITLASQKGVIDGLAFEMSVEKTLHIPQADDTYPRIDLVVLEKHQQNRTLKIIHKQGKASDNPVAPTITQTPGGLYELPLFKVSVSAKQTKLESKSITDQRNMISKHLIAQNTKDIAVINTQIVRTGEMVAWAGTVNNIPKNALLCDGSPISRTTYKDLFDKIGYAWGRSGGNFHIPDGRGGVPKGVGCSEKYDYLRDTDNKNRSVGSYQNTAIRNMKGHLGANGYKIFGQNIGGVFYGTKKDGDCGFKTGGAENYSEVNFEASQVVPTGTSNRDNNFGINWIIFYK